MDYIDDFNELIKKSALGNADAFRTLYEHLIDKVFAYVRYRSHSEDDATDITQEIFVDFYKSLPNFTYASREQFYGFVFTITKRKLAKYYANKHTRAIKNQSEFDEQKHGEFLDNSSVSDEVTRALEKLDALAREIVVLHHWSRYTFSEIATLISMKESAVRVRHHRALKMLSVSLGSQ